MMLKYAYKDFYIRVLLIYLTINIKIKLWKYTLFPKNKKERSIID